MGVTLALDLMRVHHGVEIQELMTECVECLLSSLEGTDTVVEQNHQVGDMKRSAEWKNMLNSAESVGHPYQDQERLKGRILIDIEIMTGMNGIIMMNEDVMIQGEKIVKGSS